MEWDPLKTAFRDEEITYDGNQIKPQWAFRTFGISGDSAVCFLGPCDVALGEMVDLEDVRQGLTIRSDRMLHFLIEHFDRDLHRGVLRQRLLTALVCEDVNRRKPGALQRRGDDLFAPDGRKASVSIAAPTPVSVKIHFGINVDPTGAPVPAVGLGELGIEPRAFGEAVLALYRAEMAGVYHARCKVRSAE
jgi:hypothetical protein